MKSWGRTLRVGLVVALIFFGWYMREIYMINWRFRLFSLKDWQFVWHELQAGWVIDTPYEWSWLIMCVMMLVMFGLLWWVSVKISWRKSLMTVARKIKRLFFKPNVQKIVRKKIKVRAKSSHKKVRPAPMAVGGGRPAVKQTGRTMDAGPAAERPARAEMPAPSAAPIPSVQVAEPAAPTVGQEDLSAEEISQIPLSEIQMPERMRLEENLAEILTQANYCVIQNAVVNGVETAYVGVAVDRIVLCLTDT